MGFIEPAPNDQTHSADLGYNVCVNWIKLQCYIGLGWYSTSRSSAFIVNDSVTQTVILLWLVVPGLNYQVPMNYIALPQSARECCDRWILLRLTYFFVDSVAYSWPGYRVKCARASGNHSAHSSYVLSQWILCCLVKGSTQKDTKRLLPLKKKKNIYLESPDCAGI